MTKRQPSLSASVILCLCIYLCMQATLLGVTLQELRKEEKLTPQKFASHFSSFQFKFRGEVQSPDVFLATETGDCDDFATLAAQVLSEKGYTTRLIAVRLESVVHVVCYVEETRSYLDYNNRSYLRKTVSSGGSVSEIADKVAKSFDEKWTTASEFTYKDRMKRLVSTTVGTNRRMASKPADVKHAFPLLSLISR